MNNSIEQNIAELERRIQTLKCPQISTSDTWKTYFTTTQLSVTATGYNASAEGKLRFLPHSNQPTLVQFGVLNTEDDSHISGSVLASENNNLNFYETQFKATAYDGPGTFTITFYVISTQEGELMTTDVTFNTY